MSPRGTLRLIPGQLRYIPDAAALFARKFAQQRQVVPILPAEMERPAVVSGYLQSRFATGNVMLALDQDRLVGYLGWYQVDGFRQTERRAAYLPEWGHAVEAGRERELYTALYTAAGERWAQAGCDVHAITLLADDAAAQATWFRNGFGMSVVDAIRPIQPLQLSQPAEYRLLPATIAEIDTLGEIEAEHWRHYLSSPIFMQPPAPAAPLDFANFLQQPGCSAWLALDGASPAAYLRFEPSSHGAAAIVSSATTIAITGAYVRPAYRGKRLAPSLLDAALQEYQRQGYERCSVDYESFNPEAAQFWPRYFQPVCHSLIRVPEHIARPAAQ